MLKPVLIVAFFITVIGIRPVNAQTTFKSTTQLGINAGFNLNRVYFVPSVTQKLLKDNSFGVVFRQVSEPHIGLQLEVNYSGKGWIENRDSLGTYKRNLQVVDFPMMAAFITGKKKSHLVVTLGPYVSYLIDEKEKIAVDPANYETYYQKPLVNNWEFGFILGTSLEFQTKLGTFGIRASYSNSLTNLFPLNVDEFYFNSSRTQVLNTGITYLIGL